MPATVDLSRDSAKRPTRRSAWLSEWLSGQRSRGRCQSGPRANSKLNVACRFKLMKCHDGCQQYDEAVFEWTISFVAMRASVAFVSSLSHFFNYIVFNVAMSISFFELT